MTPLSSRPLPHLRIARRTLAAVFAFALAAAAGRAELSVAPLFSDRAVLQREKPVPIWGRADPGEKIVVTFAGQTREATTAPDGRWLVILDALPASNQGSELTIAGKNTLTFRDVVVGEVWLCSGQSNMEWPVARSADAAREIAAAKFPLLRHIKIARTVAEQPAHDADTGPGWQGAMPEVVGEFSAVAYFFARDLHQKLGIPIGVINATWGGSPIEAWLSAAALVSDPAFGFVDARWSQTLAEFPAQQSAFERDLAARAAAEAAAKAQGAAAHAAFRKKDRPPRAPIGPGHHATPRGLFNGMINPLLPYSLRGVLWYQGENNVPRHPEYHAFFRTLITSWRAHLGQGDVPFYWVNLAAYKYPNDPTGVAAAFLRETQTKALALPNTGQAVTIDIGNPNNIHPANKQEVGRRLALLARNRVYGIVGDDTGPTFASATVETLPGGRAAMRVRFTHTGGGLIAYDKPVQSLQLAGADGVFHPAEATIDRDSLLVTSRAVPKPVAVRYAWSNAPDANLYDGAGLPAVPFRSDAK